MNGPVERRRGRAAPAAAMPRLAAAMLLGTLAGGCDYPFHPYQDDHDAPFSMIGYLDQKADTQWVRVMPVRQNLLLDPGPIDAVVTLEEVATGRTVTMNDSVFSFTDPRLEGVAYAHNYWTTERLEPEATYRLKAVRSDGASTTATIALPPELAFTYLNDAVDEPGVVFLRFHAEHVLSVDVLHTVMHRSGEPAARVAVRQNAPIPTTEPGYLATNVDASGTIPDDLSDVVRLEIRIVSSRADWPYLPKLSDLEVSAAGHDAQQRGERLRLRRRGGRLDHSLHPAA